MPETQRIQSGALELDDTCSLGGMSSIIGFAGICFSYLIDDWLRYEPRKNYRVIWTKVFTCHAFLQMAF